MFQIKYTVGEGRTWEYNNIIKNISIKTFSKCPLDCVACESRHTYMVAVTSGFHRTFFTFDRYWDCEQGEVTVRHGNTTLSKQINQFCPHFLIFMSRNEFLSSSGHERISHRFTNTQERIKDDRCSLNYPFKTSRCLFFMYSVVTASLMTFCPIFLRGLDEARISLCRVQMTIKES